jgi:hypothetical protein
MTCASGWLILSRMREMHCPHCRPRVLSVCSRSPLQIYIVDLANNHFADKFRPKFLESRRVGLEYFLKSVYHRSSITISLPRTISHALPAVSF